MGLILLDFVLCLAKANKKERGRFTSESWCCYSYQLMVRGLKRQAVVSGEMDVKDDFNRTHKVYIVHYENNGG